MMMRVAVVVDGPVENETANTFGCCGVSAVEVGDGFLGVAEVLERFPRLFLAGVSDPLDQVFDAVSADSRVDDVFNFVLGDVSDDVGRGWGRLTLIRI